MLCRVLMERLPLKGVETIYLANPSLSRDEILQASPTTSGSRRRRAHTILLANRRNACQPALRRQRRVVVLIDEAHAMPTRRWRRSACSPTSESNRQSCRRSCSWSAGAERRAPSWDNCANGITCIPSSAPLSHAEAGSTRHPDGRAGYHGPDIFAPAGIKRFTARRRASPATQHPGRQGAPLGVHEETSMPSPCPTCARRVERLRASRR